MSEWSLQTRIVYLTAKEYLIFRVFYKETFVAEIFHSQGQFEIVDRNGVNIDHDIAKTWPDSSGHFEKETVQRLLFAIKQHIDCCFSFIDYEIED